MPRIEEAGVFVRMAYSLGSSEFSDTQTIVQGTRARVDVEYLHSGISCTRCRTILAGHGEAGPILPNAGTIVPPQTSVFSCKLRIQLLNVPISSATHVSLEPHRQPNRPTRRYRFLLVTGAFILVIFVVFASAPTLSSRWARRAARRLLEKGAVTAAEDWLNWSARFTPKDGRADLLRARCFRLLQQPERYDEAIRSARQNNAPAELIERETALARISAGNLPNQPEGRMNGLIEAGTSSNDVHIAFIYAHLYRNQLQQAKALLDEWTAVHPQEANAAYMGGIYWGTLGDLAQAQLNLELALDLEPLHELARTVLADLLERQGELEQALIHRTTLANNHPFNEIAVTNLARLLRKTGRADDARHVVSPLTSRTDVSNDFLWELGEIAFELGDYCEAQRLFRKSRMTPAGGYASILASAATTAPQNDQARTEMLLSVESYATALSLSGDVLVAGQVFEQLSALYDRLQVANDLRAKLMRNPGNARVARQFMMLSETPLVAPAEEPFAETANSGPELFARHCAVCHGDDGSGNGRAARHLYPRPKNFRLGSFRIISTLSGIPSHHDLETTIRRGMPGSSMPPFDYLTDDEIAQLAEDVIRLYRDGIRDQLIASMRVENDEIDETEIDEILEEMTAPGETVVVPPIGTSSVDKIALGRRIYDRMGCVHCHGEDGSGPSDTLLIDDEGRLTSSRDLAYEPLKGGEAPESVYLRIMLGMPGTPHPSCSGLTDEEMVDLVHFCLSLRGASTHHLTNHDRLIRALRPKN